MADYPSYGLRKAERLRGKAADTLFEGAAGGFCFPFRYMFKPRSEEVGDKARVSVMFAVPKRQIRHAVGRNLLKRRSREAYRLNKTELTALAESKRLHIDIGLIYGVKESCDYQRIENGIKRILAKIGEAL